MKNPLGRSTDHTNVLQTLITSTKLLQEASCAPTVPVQDDPLLTIAIDRLETIKGLKANKDIGEELAEKIVHQVTTIYHELSRPAVSEEESVQMRESIARYTQALMEAHEALDRLTQRGILGKSLLRGRDRRQLQGVTLGIDREFDSFMASIGKEQKREFRRSLHITSTLMPDSSDYAPARPMSPSPTHNASFLAQQSQYTYCWPGTRMTLLDEMDHWAETSTSDNSLVYWLADIAGSGKSTIAQSLADDWRDRKILGGHHDFALRLKRFDYDFISEMFESWSNQLATTFPERAAPINQAREELKNSAVELNWSFEDYLRFLVLQPLSNLQRAHHGLSPQAKIVFILDSLDECPPDVSAKIIQGLKLVNASHGVKFLLISRLYPGDHESDLAAEILQLPSVTRGSININSAFNMADILQYLTSQFQLNAPRFHNEAQFRSALIEPTIRVLAKKANGLFLWAQLAFEVFLSAENPTKALLNLVEEDALATIDGLYLEMLLLIQVKLDRKDKELDKELLSTFNPSKGDWAGQVRVITGERFPKNALSLVLSLIAYSLETLSVETIAEFTGLGLERTWALLRYLHIVLDVCPRGDAVYPSRPSERRYSMSRSNSALPHSPTSPSSPLPSTSPKQSKRRAASKSRHSALSPSRKRRPSALSLKKSSTSLNAGSTSYTDMPFPIPSGEPETSMDLARTAGLATAFPSQSGADLRSGALVRIKHATFREWLCQSHPPTLISSLIGASVDEEEDLRFVVAPTEEVGQAMLARCSLSLLATSAASIAPSDPTTSQKDDASKPVDGKPKSVKDGESTQQEEMLDYAGRYWPAHCASLISAFHSVDESAMYANSTMTPGSRWYDLRQDMFQFLRTKLLWWVDTCCCKKWTKQARSGLVELREVLLDVIPEEDLQADISDLTQWVEEAIRLLDSPSGASSIPIDDRTDEHSLIWKYYSIELVRREEALEMLRREEERRRREEEERKAREAEERRLREETERKAREEAERKAREEAERTAREEAERKAREEAERRAREEVERKAREEAERKAKEESERKAHEEAERRAREEAERKVREEALRKGREEAEHVAREEAERKEREEAERRIRDEAERKARQEALRRAQAEAERVAREEAERKAAREEAERKAREESQKKAREEAERVAGEEDERKIQEEVARIAQEAERKISEETALRAQQEAEQKRRAMQEAKELATRKRRETEGSDHRVPQERESSSNSVLPRGRAKSDGAPAISAGILDLRLPEDMSLLDSIAALSFADGSFQVDSPTATKTKIPKATSESNTDGDGCLSTDKESTRSIPVTPTSDLEPSIPTARDEITKTRLHTTSPAPSNAPTVRPTPPETSSKASKSDAPRPTNSNPRSGRRPPAPQPTSSGPTLFPALAMFQSMGQSSHSHNNSGIQRHGVQGPPRIELARPQQWESDQRKKPSKPTNPQTQSFTSTKPQAEAETTHPR
ncbi:hypothetical protein CPB86DRAFT_176090 [Serendipita vermifera]|nr:hypothetical protein CPB86DRAFT_176090 [Serendipita vermifera]